MPLGSLEVGKAVHLRPNWAYHPSRCNSTPWVPARHQPLPPHGPHLLFPVYLGLSPFSDALPASLTRSFSACLFLQGSSCHQMVSCLFVTWLDGASKLDGSQSCSLLSLTPGTVPGTLGTQTAGRLFEKRSGGGVGWESRWL